MKRSDPRQTATTVLRERYGEADSLLLAGSVVRGEETATSDLDLVVLYPQIEQSYRESFMHGGWPIETFVHDEHTIEYYFVEKDLVSGIGSMMWMVSDGLPIVGSTALNTRIKSRANRLLDSGPPTWSSDQIDYSRYAITGLLDDLAEPRDKDEYRATVAALYNLVANHFLRSKQHWGATSKTIPRRLTKVDENIARRYGDAFASAFRDNPKPLFLLSDHVLEPSGGRLFEGYAARSDPKLRRNPPSISDAE
jgi:hypothetical protein